MDYRKFDDKYLIRLDPDDEVVESIKKICKDNRIRLGQIIGFGTTKCAKVGLLDTTTKEYHPKEYTGDFEITSIIGTISEKEGEVYLHIHMNFADKNNVVFGGHLDHAFTSAVCEIMLIQLDGESDRIWSDEVGVNLLTFK